MNKKQKIKGLETEIKYLFSEEKRLKEENLKGFPKLPERYDCCYCHKQSFNKMKKFKYENFKDSWIIVSVCDKCLKK